MNPSVGNGSFPAGEMIILCDERFKLMSAERILLNVVETTFAAAATLNERGGRVRAAIQYLQRGDSIRSTNRHCAAVSRRFGVAIFLYGAMAVSRRK